MLNVSQMNGEESYHNITILSRPPTVSTSQSKSGSSVGPSVGSTQVTKQPFVAHNQTTRRQCKQIESNSLKSCVEESSSVSSSVSSSQCLRSTVLANDDNNDVNNGDIESTSETIAEKSPMCRINEISRFNDIKHEYHLVGESGPPHDKTFTVILKLGDIEEFRGSGPSIKKAQRSAAAVALQQTKLKQPIPRTQRHNKSVWPMTPTVELNVLAMKLGQTAVYQVYEPPRQQAPTFSIGPISLTSSPSNAYDFRGMHYQRYHIPRGPFCAALSVGSRQFMGKGHTAQAARHAAAEEALKVLRRESRESHSSNELSPLSPDLTSNPNPNENYDLVDSNDVSNDSNNCNKSPISLVHEMALKRNWSVSFQVIDESGPSHMPKFVTKCSVGHIVTTGEGNGKKMSKKNAALRMVEELNKLPPLVVSQTSDANNDCVEQHNTSTKKSAIRSTRKKSFNKRKTNNNIISNESNDNNCIPLKTHSNRLETTLQTNSNNESISDSIQLMCNSNDSETNSSITRTNDISVAKECGHLLGEMAIDGRDGSSEDSEGAIHPINRLIQLQQTRREKEPNFTLISDRVIDRRRREFTIECRVHLTKGTNGPQTVSAIGLGPNKKLAKKNAADQMLQLLGYGSLRAPQSILKQDSCNTSEGHTSEHKKIRQVKFIENNTTTATIADINCQTNYIPKMGRQLVPGLILMPKEMSTNVSPKSGLNLSAKHSSQTSHKLCSDTNSHSMTDSNISENITTKIKLISKMAKEFIGSNNCSNEVINDEKLSTNTSNRSQQLKSLAETIGTHQLQVHFNDFPKRASDGQSVEYLSVVTITTVWNQSPIVSHGSGHTMEEARNQASHQAIIQLTQIDDNK